MLFSMLGNCISKESPFQINCSSVTSTYKAVQKRLHEKKKERDPKESRGSYFNPEQLADVLNKG